MKKMKIAGVLIVLLAVFTAAVNVMANQRGEDEASALHKAKISLSQAIETALAAVPGKALSAELDTENNQPVFVVEVVSQGQTQEVTLGTQNGKVLGKKLDAEDRDDHDCGEKDRD